MKLIVKSIFRYGGRDGRDGRYMVRVLVVYTGITARMHRRFPPLSLSLTSG